MAAARLAQAEEVPVARPPRPRPDLRFLSLLHGMGLSFLGAGGASIASDRSQSSSPASAPGRRSSALHTGRLGSEAEAERNQTLRLQGPSFADGQYALPAAAGIRAGWGPESMFDGRTWCRM